MTLLPLLAFAALEFLPQDLPDFAPNTAPFFPLGAADYRLADINGDGRPDWLLPGIAVLYGDGGLNSRAPIPMPQAETATLCDNHGNCLYLLSENRLRIVALKGNAFEQLLEQPFSWLDTDDAGATPELERFAGRRQGLAFERFLQDLNGDGTPEIAVPRQSGLVIYEKHEGRYHRAAVLGVFPSMTVPRLAPQDLWPQDAREILLPPQTMACQFGLEAGKLWVLTREELPENRVRYHLAQGMVARDASGMYAFNDRTEQHSDPMPDCMQPVRLNGDDRMDYAGGDWQFSRNALLPTPIATLHATLDGGKTIQSLRSVAFGPARVFADIDGDGDIDLAVESTGMFEGGVREALTRFVGARDTTHEVRVHFQDGAGAFSKKPDMVLRVSIKFDAPPVQSTNRLLEYQRGNLLNVTGDFDGDKRRDVAAFARPDGMDIHLNQGTAFAHRPDAVIPMPANADFDVLDADGDGASDIVAGWNDANGIRRGRVFFARPGVR